MHGPDVAEVQRLLGVEDDGDYGPQTARAVADWKRARGVVPASRELDPLDTPAALVVSHSPFAWGVDGAHAVETAIALEAVAEIGLLTLALEPLVPPLPFGLP